MNALVDEISDITGQQIEDEQERDDRLKKIEAQRNSGIMKRNMKQEDDRNKKADPVYQAEMRRRQEIEKAKYRKVKGFKSIGSFLDDLTNAIDDQITEYQLAYDDPTRLNRYHQDDGIVAPGTSTRWEQEENVPSIDVYFDRSGSWKGDRAAIDFGESVIKTLLKYEKEGLLILRVYYFSQHYITTNKDDPKLGGGTDSLCEILDNIVKNDAKNVILLTDSDFDNLSTPKRHVKVDGCVWYIWRRGYQSEWALEYLGSIDPSMEFQYSL